LPANVDDCAYNLGAAAASNAKISEIRSARLTNRAFSGDSARLTRSNGGEHFGVAFFMGCFWPAWNEQNLNLGRACGNRELPHLDVKGDLQVLYHVLWPLQGASCKYLGAELFAITSTLSCRLLNSEISITFFALD
jgi:hypothetical protein